MSDGAENVPGGMGYIKGVCERGAMGVIKGLRTCILSKMGEGLSEGLNQLFIRLLRIGSGRVVSRGRFRVGGTSDQAESGTGQPQQQQLVVLVVPTPRKESNQR